MSDIFIGRICAKILIYTEWGTALIFTLSQKLLNRETEREKEVKEKEIMLNGW